MSHHRLATGPRLQQADDTKCGSSGPRKEMHSSTRSALTPRPAVSVPRGRSGKASRVKRQSSRYLGLVTWTTAETWSEDPSDDLRSVTERRGSITLQVPLSSVQIDFHYTLFMGTPSYALNVNHVIDPYSELGQQIGDIMVRRRDLPKLRRLLSDRKLSVYSLYRGSNLFSVSVVPGVTSSGLLCLYGPDWLADCL